MFDIIFGFFVGPNTSVQCFEIKPEETAFLGKVMDRNLFSDVDCMETLIDNVEDGGQFRDKGEFKPFVEWPGITLDVSGNVTVIDWESTEIDHLYGTINLFWTPPRVEDLRVTGHSLQGTINTAALPRNLSALIAFCNMFHGTFATQELPNMITEVLINNNYFHGPLDLQHLPGYLVAFEASNNRFSGSINLSSLPPSLVDLSLSFNLLEGPIELSKIPESLEYLSLKNNAIVQDEVIFPVLNQCQRIRLEGNDIERLVEQHKH